MREGHFSAAGKRHLREWIGGAEISFADPDLAIERRVHLLRVTGKQLRAVLRLAALETGKKWPRRHAAAIQTAARELGPYRDAAVASALLEKRERKERSARIKDLWQRWCAWRAAREGSPEIPPPLLLTRLLLTLQEAEERLACWLDRLVLEEGLQAGWDVSVADLRAGAEAFSASPDNPAAHLWR